MANHKRQTPLTPEESKERNRRYAQTRREKTNNKYSRAYRRTMQKCVDWIQENREDLWELWLNEEQKVENTTPYIKGNVFGCLHNGAKSVTGLMIRCGECGEFLGAQAITKDQQEQAAEWIDPAFGTKEDPEAVA